MGINYEGIIMQEIKKLIDRLAVLSKEPNATLKEKDSINEMLASLLDKFGFSGDISKRESPSVEIMEYAKKRGLAIGKKPFNERSSNDGDNTYSIEKIR